MSLRRYSRFSKPHKGSSQMPAAMQPEEAKLNQFYDVVAWNGLAIGTVRYAFFDGSKWCIAIRLSVGEPAWGEAPGEFEPFVLRYGDASWVMPTVRPTPEPEGFSSTLPAPVALLTQQDPLGEG